jgi:hypothetical protein
VARAHRRVTGQAAEEPREQRLAPSWATRAGSGRAQVERALHTLEHVAVDDGRVLAEEQLVTVADLAPPT